VHVATDIPYKLLQTVFFMVRLMRLDGLTYAPVKIKGKGDSRQAKAARRQLLSSRVGVLQVKSSVSTQDFALFAHLIFLAFITRQ
jgi:hypothetical protein